MNCRSRIGSARWPGQKGFSLALALAAGFAGAQTLPTNNLALVMPYTGAPLIEASADVLVQLPAQVDDRSPVPVRIRVLQEPVEWISLLSDAAEPALLARFSLEKGALPEVSTRFFDRGARGLQVIATTPGRYLANRHLISRAPQPDALAGAAEGDIPDILPSQAGSSEMVTSQAISNDAEPLVASDAQASAGALPPAMALQLSARRSGKKTLVRLTSGEGLLALSSPMSVPVFWVRDLRLYHQQGRVLSAELSPALWYKPFFQFALTGAEVGDTLVLELVANDGAVQYLTTSVEAPE